MVCFTTIIAKRHGDQSNRVSWRYRVTVVTYLENLVTSVLNRLTFGVPLPQRLLHLYQNRIYKQLRYRSSVLTERQFKNVSLEQFVGKTVGLYIKVQDADLYGFRFE